MLPAVGTDLIRHIVMTESTLSCFDLVYNIAGVFPDIFQKRVLAEFSLWKISESFCSQSCGKIRFLQIFRHQFQKLFSF